MSTCSANSKVQFALLKVVNLYLLIYYRVLEYTKITDSNLESSSLLVLLELLGTALVLIITSAE